MRVDVSPEGLLALQHAWGQVIDEPREGAHARDVAVKSFPVYGAMCLPGSALSHAGLRVSYNRRLAQRLSFDLRHPSVDGVHVQH